MKADDETCRTRQPHIWHEKGTRGVTGISLTSNEVGNEGFVESAGSDIDFAKRLRTARVFGFGFPDLSRKGCHTPKIVRNILTTTVIEVTPILFLIIHRGVSWNLEHYNFLHITLIFSALQ